MIISATDGVFDNLFNHEILNIITTDEAKLMTPAELAKKIVTSAHEKVTTTEKIQTPYQRKYKKTYNCSWEGGKDDDITCVVTRVVTD